MDLPRRGCGPPHDSTNPGRSSPPCPLGTSSRGRCVRPPLPRGSLVWASEAGPWSAPGTGPGAPPSLGAWRGEMYEWLLRCPQRPQTPGNYRRLCSSGSQAAAGPGSAPPELRVVLQHDVALVAWPVPPCQSLPSSLQAFVTCTSVPLQWHLLLEAPLVPQLETCSPSTMQSLSWEDWSRSLEQRTAPAVPSWAGGWMNARPALKFSGPVRGTPGRSPSLPWPAHRPALSQLACACTTPAQGSPQPGTGHFQPGWGPLLDLRKQAGSRRAQEIPRSH